jgi:uncharacterized protein YdeI (BOF family)
MAPIVLLAGCADSDNATAANNNMTAPDKAALAAADDGQWVTLTGRVVSSSPREFVLDYGAGNVVVEVDDWDKFQEGRLIKPGDQVTVTGLADEDLLMRKRIEARSIYVRNLNSVFVASSDDEETLRARAAMTAASIPDYADVAGVVTAVEGGEFTVGTGPTAIRIDTSLLADNPVDKAGLLRLKIGDRVFVWGQINLEPAEGAELKARGLVTVLPTAVVPVAGQTGNMAVPAEAASNASNMTESNAMADETNAATGNTAG